MTNVLWACGFVLACIAFYRYALPWLRRFEQANVARIAQQLGPEPWAKLRAAAEGTTWEELLPPSGGPPETAGVATLFADGNVLLSGFGEGQDAMQGMWTASGDRSATLTVVGLMVGGNGISDGTLRLFRQSLVSDD